MTHYWKYRIAIHSVLGTIALIATVAGSLLILRSIHFQWVIKAWHNLSGLLFSGLCILLCLGGFFALYLRKYSNFDWRTKRLLRLVAIHKAFGYFIIFSVQIAVVTGILRRYKL
jgi:hypothetical protein